jgi:hypothetical protein
MKQIYSLILVTCVAFLCANTVAAAGIERNANVPLTDDVLNGVSDSFVGSPSAPVQGAVETVTDGGFETGSPNPVWTEHSTNFGTPLCTVAACGTGTGTGPHAGSWWAWFGGTSPYEQGQVVQALLIPTGIATLTFWMEKAVCQSASDYLEVTIDGTQVWVTTGSGGTCGALGYVEQTVDVSAFANDGVHVITFNSEKFAGHISNFFVDDVSLDVDVSTTFEVNKIFSDGNTGSVDVTLDCFTGLPITQTQTISQSQNVTFIVTNFANGTLDCDVTEVVPQGYSASYNNGTVVSATGCEFDDVSIGEDNVCTITNTPINVNVIVNKDWIIEGTGGGILDPTYTLTLFCDAFIEGFTGSGAGVWSKILFNGKSDQDRSFLSKVTPYWGVGGSKCWVSETAFSSAVEINLADCGTSLGNARLQIFIGRGDECTVTNTVFFEGIPTLNQYGMAILALLMLGVGFVGFRRFA